MNGAIPVTLRVFIPFAAGYFLSYLYRVVNAVIAPDLVRDLTLRPSALGLLTASYFIAFASSQLPLGVLLDRYGPRRVEALLLLFAAAGALLFARSGTLAGVVAGRALIGFGVSACLMAAFKSYTMWFPRHRWPLVNGFQMAAGGLGALTATAPVEAALRIIDWRGIFTVLAGLTLLVALAVYAVVPERQPDGAGHPLKDQLREVKGVFTSLTFWQVAPLTTLSQATFLSVQGLWAGPWMRDAAGLDRLPAAQVLLVVAAAMVAGFLVLGSLAERLSRTGISVLSTAVAGMALFMTVQALILAMPARAVLPLWGLFGFFGTSGIIAYAALSQHFPVHLSGRVTTAINLLVFVAAFTGQWAIGAIIGRWPVDAGGHYALAGYRTGFGLMLGLQVVVLLWFFIAGRMCAGQRASQATTGQDAGNP